MYALIDSERDAAGAPIAQDRLDFKAGCDARGIPCHILDRRALENYFTDKAVKAALGSSFTALTDYELLKSHPNAWAKTYNWRIAGELTRDELDPTDLGQVLRGIATDLDVTQINPDLAALVRARPSGGKGSRHSSPW
jgi:hypothetical protein